MRSRPPLHRPGIRSGESRILQRRPAAAHHARPVPRALPLTLQYGHRYQERVGNPGFDADKFMQFYSGKNAYRSFAPPENSNVEAEPISRHDWLMATGYTVTDAKPWVLPDLGYTQSRQRALPAEEEPEKEAAPEAGRT